MLREATKPLYVAFAFPGSEDRRGNTCFWCLVWPVKQRGHSPLSPFSQLWVQAGRRQSLTSLKGVRQVPALGGCPIKSPNTYWAVPYLIRQVGLTALMTAGQTASERAAEGQNTNPSLCHLEPSQWAETSSAKRRGSDRRAGFPQEE